MQDLEKTCGLLGALPGSETLGAIEKGIELARKGVRVYMLSVGEPDFDTPDAIKQAAWDALRQGHTRYTVPAGIQELREACADKFRRDGIDTDWRRVVVTPGGKFACAAAITALCGPGDEAILPVPYWVSHLHMINASGATPVPVETRPENNFELTEEDLRRHVTDRTRLLVLCSPSNPTGAVYRREALERIAGWAVRRNFMVLSDEVYEKLTYDPGLPHVGIASLSPEISRRTVTVNSFSKSHAMTGWRVGYLTAPPWLTARIDALQTHFVANVTTFAQYAALKALRDCAGDCERMRRAFAARRDLFCGLLARVPHVRFRRPAGAFYVFCDVSDFGLGSAAFCDRLMSEAQVAAAPGCGFGADRFIRFSFACSEDDIREALGRFARFCASLGTAGGPARPDAGG